MMGLEHLVVSKYKEALKQGWDVSQGHMNWKGLTMIKAGAI